jgi:putative ATP-binding cassette transporter
VESAPTQAVRFDRRTAVLIGGAAKELLVGDVRWHARALLALLLLFALSVNGLNVVNSYVGRDFMTAISRKDMGGFLTLALVYIGVFAASTAIAVLYRFTEERLGVLWRTWLTKRRTTGYLAGRTYLAVKESGEVDNPDQRIAEDIRAFTVTALSFTLITLNGILAAISFSGVLLTISVPLFAVAVCYAALGTAMAIRLGRPLIGLNYAQSAREADFRASLIHVGENAEAIALSASEGRLTGRLHKRMDELAMNFRRVISVNRNLGFFTTGYNYLIQIIPILLIAPAFIRGEIEFGIITQSAMAFGQLLAAFSVIINQYTSISSFAAVIARLADFVQVVEATQARRPDIVTDEDRGRIAYQGLTLRSGDGATLVRDLSVSIPSGMRVLVSGPSEPGRVVLFLATAGLWTQGEGRIVRPPLDAVAFVPQQPYLPPGTLRQALVASERDEEIPDERILAVLDNAGLGYLLRRVGGLHVEREWPKTLLSGEQQQLVLARLLLAQPAFAVLDRVGSNLGAAQLEQWLHRLTASRITYITYLSLNEAPPSAELYDAVLEIDADGSWNWQRK